MTGHHPIHEITKAADHQQQGPDPEFAVHEGSGGSETDQRSQNRERIRIDSSVEQDGEGHLNPTIEPVAEFRFDHFRSLS
jgi:hypothetical protein